MSKQILYQNELFDKAEDDQKKQEIPKKIDALEIRKHEIQSMKKNKDQVSNRDIHKHKKEMQKENKNKEEEQTYIMNIESDTIFHSEKKTNANDDQYVASNTTEVPTNAIHNEASFAIFMLVVDRSIQRRNAEARKEVYEYLQNMNVLITPQQSRQSFRQCKTLGGPTFRKAFKDTAIKLWDFGRDYLNIKTTLADRDKWDYVLTQWAEDDQSDDPNEIALNIQKRYDDHQ